MSDLEQEIEIAVSKLMAGEQDPADVLRDFAGRVRKPVERIETLKVCSGCEEEGALCFNCKVKEVVGEQAMLAAPLILPKVMGMAQEAIKNALAARQRRKAEERARRRQEEERQAGYEYRKQGWPRGQTPPPAPPGPQSF